MKSKIFVLLQKSMEYLTMRLENGVKDMICLLKQKI